MMDDGRLAQVRIVPGKKPREVIGTTYVVDGPNGPLLTSGSHASAIAYASGYNEAQESVAELVEAARAVYAEGQAYSEPKQRLAAALAAWPLEGAAT